MTNLTHLDALQARLRRENDRLATAKTPADREFRLQQIRSCENEIANEYRFLGIDPVVVCDMSDDDLLRELGA